jgi:sec-independent protein translocase protein TatB
MFDSIGFQELILIGLVALLVVGPKELPLLARKMGRWSKKIRGMAMEFRASFDDLARQAELDELRQEVENLRTMKPIQELRDTMNERVDLTVNPNLAAASQSEPAATEPYVAAPEAIDCGPALVTPAKPKKPRAPRKQKLAPSVVEPAGDPS